MTEPSSSIPKRGMERAALLEQMEAFRGGDVNWHGNRVFALVYHHSDAHTETLKAAYNLYFSENGLNPMAFKSLQKMERTVVGMTAGMFHGDADVVGCMTSGGTESLLLPVLTYRNRARRKRPWVRKPEFIVPESAHVGFIKAGEYFDVKIIRAPLKADFTADVAAMERLITRNTIGLAGSAPNYPYGAVDPIEELGALALRHKLPLHVDGCLGGFFLPWVEKLGTPVPLFDFRVPGVTSISADIHKYGYAAKGASTILYRNQDYFRDQIFAEVNWCGGVYGGPTLAGTRPGGAIAAAWASMQALGEDGYMENARRVMEVAGRFKEGIASVPGLCVLGTPVMGVLACGAADKHISMYAVADRLEEKGWHIDRLQKPEAVHLILNAGHADIADEYLADLREAVEHVKTHPDAALEGSAPMYGLIAKAPMRTMVKRNVVSILANLYAQKPDAGQETDEAEESAPGVPKPVLFLMKLAARVKRLFGR